ncbi:hypothetical protein GY45DRAFT_1320654 [Cubamyces sp. BRFM 1775]|nr:hypothetical protein GY45DRAFT_1320654 [Cubamyces sp. BRFM 1775]
MSYQPERRQTLPRLSIPSDRGVKRQTERDRVASNYHDFPYSSAGNLTALDGLPQLGHPQMQHPFGVYTSGDLMDAHLADHPPVIYAPPSHNEMPTKRFLAPIPLPSIASYPAEDVAAQDADDNGDASSQLLRCEDLLPGAHAMFQEHVRAMFDARPHADSASLYHPQRSPFVPPRVADQPALGLILPTATYSVHPSPPTPVLRPLPASSLPPVPPHLSRLPLPLDLPRHEHVRLEDASRSRASGVASVPRTMGMSAGQAPGHAYPGRSTHGSRMPSFAQPAMRERGTPRGDRR